MLIHVTQKTLRSLLTKEIIKFMIICSCITATILVLFMSASTWFITNIFDLSHWFFSGLISASLGIIAWFMFPILLPLIVTILTGYVIPIIEKQSYPNAQPQHHTTLRSELLHDLKFMLTSLTLNILALPIYFTGIGMIIYYMLNGYLLGREFFGIAGGRYIGKEEASKKRKQHRYKIWLCGIALTALFTIPLINLIVPIIAIIAMIHLYHSL